MLRFTHPSQGYCTDYPLPLWLFHKSSHPTPFSKLTVSPWYMLWLFYSLLIPPRLSSTPPTSCWLFHHPPPAAVPLVTHPPPAAVLLVTHPPPAAVPSPPSPPQPPRLLHLSEGRAWPPGYVWRTWFVWETSQRSHCTLLAASGWSPGSKRQIIII